jgi:3-oxoacyl-[acyl-carrier protein] reductase
MRSPIRGKAEQPVAGRHKLVHNGCMELTGRNIVVTGGAMGIGAATVKILAARGVRVFIADRDQAVTERIIEATKDSSGSAEFIEVDLADAASIRSFGKTVAGMTDSLHGLVNNAGIVRRASIEETGDADWTEQTAVNLRAPALCIQALLPLLKAGPGHVVNVSSEGGFRARKNHWVYDATKAGICALTREAAEELAEFGIRVNAVAPGWVVTEMHFGNAPDPMAKKKELEEMTNTSAMLGRLARPEEIAASIAFLLSEDATYITGTVLHVDGGLTAR